MERLSATAMPSAKASTVPTTKPISVSASVMPMWLR